MFKNNLKIALRNFLKTKGFSLINTAGLSIGLAIVLIIGLWIKDELTYNTSVPGHERIVGVMQNQTNNGKTATWEATPPVLGDELRKSYGDDFKLVVQKSWNYEHLVTYDNKHFRREGSFVQSSFLDMVSLQMIAGNRSALDEPYSILVAESVAKTIFGADDPLGKILKLDNNHTVKVGGIFKDLPENSYFGNHYLLFSWKLFYIENTWFQPNPWASSFTRTFGVLKDGADVSAVSAKIKKTIYTNSDDGARRANAEIFLHPMNKWHLYGDFENGKNIGGRIKYIWLFGIIGGFVLLLACINFMNLATARSEKRAREVGILKTLGSVKSQLIGQYLTESIAIVFLSFILSLVLAYALIPLFNDIAEKKLSIPWSSGLFWLAALVFCLVVGVLAGSYPALYLSAFKPVKVFKGTMGAGRSAVLPRKILVVFQFSVSVALLSCTWIVYKQIQFAKDRPTGFNKDALLTTGFADRIFHSFEAFTNELKSSGAVTYVAQSSSPPGQVWRSNSGYDWKGKDPAFADEFPTSGVSHEYGKAIGWKIVQGRDFSKDILSDSSAMIITTEALRIMGLENPIGETITRKDQSWHIIGVVDNMIVGSPYSSDRAFVFFISRQQENVINMRLSNTVGTQEALGKIEPIYKKYAPSVPFNYKFTDAEFAKKFGEEERIGKLSSLFTYMALFISMLGLLGLAAFTAERRTKEIGVRKVLGATVMNICQLITREFIVLVFISFLVAVPVSWYFMNEWLQNFEYRTTITIWIYLATGLMTLLLTILVVSFQAIKAAIANPIKSLRTE